MHVLFNVLGVLLWLGFIEPLANFVATISPHAETLSGAKKLAAETPRQIANAHTIFNIANTIVFIGFVTPLARLVEWLVPDRPLDESGIVQARYLDSELLSTPSLAFDRARLELSRMGARVNEMMSAILPAVLSGTPQGLEEVRAMDDAVDQLHGHIVTYLGKASQVELSEAQTGESLGLLDAVNDLENIGDIIETNLVRNGLQRFKREFAIN